MVLEREHQQRYFTKQQLHALFDLGPTCMSQTHQELRELHGHQRTESIEIEQHRTDLEKECQEWMRGISDYHLLFSHLPVPPPESACDFIHTPSAVRTRTRKPDLSKTGPPKRARPHQAVVRRASVSSEMGIAKGDEDSMRWVTEFCSLSDFFGLDGQAQARLVACLRRARDAETRGGPKKRRERMDVLRHYLDGAELLAYLSVCCVGLCARARACMCCGCLTPAAGVESQPAILVSVCVCVCARSRARLLDI